MTNELETWFKEICKKNDEFILKGEKISSVCMAKHKDKVFMFPFMFMNSDEKIQFKETLKQILVNLPIKGYIIVMDTKLTMMAKDKEPEVFDAVVRQLYTPKKIIIDTVLYQDNKIIRRIDMGKNFTSEWNLWGHKTPINKITEQYQEFKEKHPELFKDVR